MDMMKISASFPPWDGRPCAGVRLKQKFSFSNFCPGRGLNPGPRSLMAVNETTRLRRHSKIFTLCIFSQRLCKHSQSLRLLRGDDDKDDKHSENIIEEVRRMHGLGLHKDN